MPSSGHLDPRILLSHVNASGATQHIAAVLALEDSATAWAYSQRRVEQPASSPQPAGICIAASHPYDTLSAGPADGTVATGGRLRVEEAALANGAFRGQLHHLRVSVPAKKLLRLDTVATTTTADWGSFGLTPLAPGVHLRGSWPYCAQIVESNVLEMPTNALPYGLEVGAQGAPDTVLIKKRAENEFDKHNRLLFGVHTTYTIRYDLPGERYCETAISGYWRALGTDPPDTRFTTGAAPRAAPNPTDLKVPPLWRQSDTARCVRLRKNFSYTGVGGFNERIAIAGAATLPSVIYVNFAPTPFPPDVPI